MSEIWRTSLKFNAIIENDPNAAKHHGIKGMRWGVRRYQYSDGRLTPAGKKRYSNGADKGKDVFGPEYLWVDQCSRALNKDRALINKLTNITKNDKKLDDSAAHLAETISQMNDAGTKMNNSYKLPYKDYLPIAKKWQKSFDDYAAAIREFISVARERASSNEKYNNIVDLDKYKDVYYFDKNHKREQQVSAKEYFIAVAAAKSKGIDIYRHMDPNKWLLYIDEISKQ